MAKSDIDTAQSAVQKQTGSNVTNANANLGPASQGYQNFASTGGITPGQQQLTRQQAQGNVSSIYDALNQNLSRQKAIQGGYSPGFGANEAQLARGASAASSNAVNSANLGLQQQITQNQLQGLGGLTSIGGLYQGQIPQLLNTTAQLAAAKPSWQQDVAGAEGVISGGANILKSLGGLFNNNQGQSQ